ncbi:RNA polymerase subunit sigma-24, partial [Pseudomonas frederiksbergensis]|nr:RNA polymerase subunit sigma-24 [Pseudomonas frederiksbergensis]
LVGLYDVLLQHWPSPVVELNRAAALARRDGAQAGLAAVEAILARGQLQDYHLAHSARAELCRQLGRLDQARAAYRSALE